MKDWRNCAKISNLPFKLRMPFFYHILVWLLTTIQNLVDALLVSFNYILLWFVNSKWMIYNIFHHWNLDSLGKEQQQQNNNRQTQTSKKNSKEQKTSTFYNGLKLNMEWIDISSMCLHLSIKKFAVEMLKWLFSEIKFDDQFFGQILRKRYIRRYHIKYTFIHSFIIQANSSPKVIISTV